MSSLFGILSLLAAFSAKSYALDCTQCVSTYTSCSGISVTCPSGALCASSYTETDAGGTTKVSFIRSCGSSTDCGFQGSLSIPEGQIRMGISCCSSSDNCTPDTPSLPAQSSTPNGQVCQHCVSATSTYCSSSNTMQCTGNENMCLLESTKMSGSTTSSSAIRGCATKSICDLGSQSQTTGDLTVDVKFTCSNRSISVQTFVLTPVIFCLLLTKLFF
ncbi:phospholipase A2 inhibitor 25 kDa subunit-like [Anomaloglossus baeobatrachus]|uniref:phospholipase A2 inhibitor 25 kDa subunit-like n=1 Tax=Anomaloglossus baeobatrachus TaxID=238106 RepID=UPI003F4F9939